MYNATPFVALFAMFITKIRTWALLPFFAALTKLLVMTFFPAGPTLAWRSSCWLQAMCAASSFSSVAGVAMAGLLAAMPELIPSPLMTRMSLNIVSRASFRRHHCPSCVHTLISRSINTMDARLAHAVLIAFHRFHRGSKASRARFRVVSFIESGSSL